MFDIWPPVKVKGKYGNSIIRVGNYHESCQTYMDDGVAPEDFVRLWLSESIEICRGRRKRGILATQIERNHEGKLGCVAGWLIFRIGDSIAIRDGASIGFKECARTFDLPPKDWWRCIRANKQRLDHAWKKVSGAAFRDWCGHLQTLANAMKDTNELVEDELQMKIRNRRNMSLNLNKISGGPELQTRFPADLMDQIRFVCKGVRRHEHKIAGAAGAYDFTKKLYPERNEEMLAWWMRWQFSRGAAAIVILNPNGALESGVPVHIVHGRDITGADISCFSTRARIAAKAIDRVAFSAMQLPDRLASVKDAVCPLHQFKRLLKSAAEVILGVCDGTAWATFPLNKEIGCLRKRRWRDKEPK